MERLVVPDKCTRYTLHTPAPTEYTVWREWADEKSKLYIQTRCPGSCGLWNVWIPRDAVCDSCGVIPGMTALSHRCPEFRPSLWSE